LNIFRQQQTELAQEELAKEFDERMAGELPALVARWARRVEIHGLWLEGNRRDPDAEALIAEGLRKAPHAPYALAQTVLVQDEALRNADARIRELEGGDSVAPAQGGFLDNMRDAFLGRRAEGRGSVPSVGTGRNAPAQSRAPEAPAGAPSSGGSFLGTAAASAAGVIGGALLLNSFRSMFGGGQQHGMLDSQSGQNAPWGGGNATNSDLAREAGVSEIGRGGRDAENDRAGLYDTASNESDSDDDSDDYENDSDFDLGGEDSDVA
jgi:hypothetical protein